MPLEIWLTQKLFGQDGNTALTTVEILRSPPVGDWETLPNLRLAYPPLKHCAVAVSNTEFVLGWKFMSCSQDLFQAGF